MLLGLPWPLSPHRSGDASRSLGFGVVFGTHWLYGKWSPALQSSSIEYKEFFPIVVAAHAWGSSWFRQVMLFHYDNESVVFILNSRNSRAPDVIHLVHLLPMKAAHNNFIFSAEHIPGSDNKIPDALSCFNWKTLTYQSLRRIVSQGLDPSMHRTYKSAQLRFLNFCTLSG